MRDASVLIVGAGPTGLVLALWLTRLGIAVRIVDKIAGPAAFSRALGVQARTLEFYRQMGIADAVVQASVRAAGVNIWVMGKRAARVPIGEVGTGLTPYPYILDFAQNDHERLLIDHLAARGVVVERNTELVRFEERPDGIRATLRPAGGAELQCDALYIAGCDGSHSVVRESAGIDFPGATYSHLFYVADVEASGPVANGDVHIDLDVDDLLAVFPMTGAGHVRLVGTVRDDPNRTSDQLTFDDVKARVLERMKITVTRVNWFSPYRVHHRVARSFRKGRAFLLGDASHVHSPVGAQGMNTGIGDAVNLAWKLAAVLDGHAAPELLDSYEDERIGFARRLVATTDRVFTMATRPGLIGELVRADFVPVIAPLLMRLSIVRRFLFRTVSQLALHYQESPLSVGSAGDLHGGDRLPWVTTAPGADNFSALESIGWQVHVYGEPRSDVLAACAELALVCHGFPWSPEMHDSGLAQGALYLIRPDGYIALADADADPERLRQYVSSRHLRFA